MFSRLNPKELMAWVALVIAIILFTVSVSIAQTTTIVREGNEVTFKYTSREGKNKVKIDTTFTVATEQDYEAALEKISSDYGVDLQGKSNTVAIGAGESDEDEFSYRMKVRPKLSKKELEKMNEDIKEAMDQVHSSLREMDESLKELHFKIYTESDGDDESFNFQFSMPPLPPIPPMPPIPPIGANMNGMEIIVDSDGDEHHYTFGGAEFDDEVDSLNDENHIIVFGRKNEEPPVLEKTITKKNGKRVFIFKRAEHQKDEVQDRVEGIDNLQCFPNPSNGKVTVSFVVKEESDVKISILDASGKDYYKISMKNFAGEYSNSFNLETKGNYILRVSKDGNVMTRKIVVE
jgi:hypothetical protein